MKYEQRFHHHGHLRYSKVDVSMQSSDPDDASQQSLTEADVGCGVDVIVFSSKVITSIHSDCYEHFLASTQRQSEKY